MSGNGRADEEIRREITTERRQLADALDDLRADLRAARRIPVVVGGALAAGLATAAAVVAVRRRRAE